MQAKSARLENLKAAFESDISSDDLDLRMLDGWDKVFVELEESIPNSGRNTEDDLDDLRLQLWAAVGKTRARSLDELACKAVIWKRVAPEPLCSELPGPVDEFIMSSIFTDIIAMSQARPTRAEDDLPASREFSKNSDQ